MSKRKRGMETRLSKKQKRQKEEKKQNKLKEQKMVMDIKIDEWYHDATSHYNDSNDDESLILLLSVLENMDITDKKYETCVDMATNIIHNDVFSDITHLEKEVKNNSSTAMWILGLVYLCGKIVQKNVPKGIELYERSSELDNPHSQNWLAAAYSYGELVDKDIQKAVKLYTRGAEQSNYRSI